MKVKGWTVLDKEKLELEMTKDGILGFICTDKDKKIYCSQLKHCIINKQKDKSKCRKVEIEVMVNE
jgi:hypothetical protein